MNLERLVVQEVPLSGTHQWFMGEIQAVHIDAGYTRDPPLMFWIGEYQRVGEFLKAARKVALPHRRKPMRRSRV